MGAVPLYGWGVALAGKVIFLFCRKAGGTLQLVFACPAGAYPSEVKPPFLLRESGVFYLAVSFLPARLGPKPLFLLQRKRKSGSGLRKRKGRPVEMITGYATTVQSPNPAWLSLGFKKIFFVVL